MKKFFSTDKLKILGGVSFFVIVVPAIINWLFKLQGPCSFLVAEWSAGDALSFYGTLLGSVATIVGVFLSIDYAQKNYREDEANRVRPYLALTHYKSKYKCNLFELVLRTEHDEVDRKKQEDYDYEEYRLEEVFITIGTDGILYKNSLTEAQKQSLRFGGLAWNDDGDGRLSLQCHNLLSVPFAIENVGNGASLNTKIAFYKINEKDEQKRGVNVYTIKNGESIYCHIFSDEQDPTLYGEYIFEVTYGDVLGNHYSEKFDFEFGIDPSNGKFFSSINLEGAQKRIS